MTDDTYDVIVVGGGAAGVAAAAGAAGEGARTLLIERYGFLGGAATNANVLAYCGFWTQRDTPRLGVGGVGAQVLDELAKLGLDVAPQRTASENWIVTLDPEAVKLALDRVVGRVVGRQRVDCRLHSRLIGAHRTGARLAAVLVTDHAGTREYAAAAFVDASGQADLVAAAGGGVAVPADEARQAASLPIRFGGVPASMAIDRGAVRAAIARLPDDTPSVRVRPEGGLFFRLKLSQEIWWLGIQVLTDGLHATSLSSAEVAGRATAWRVLNAFRAEVPGFEAAYISGSGPQIGIRAARTGLTRDLIGAAALHAGRTHAEGVARACWPAEMHLGLSDATYSRIGGDGFYHVPYDALRSQSLDNVWLAGRAIGCDPTVYGSLRVMGTAFATGHAAGVAAACFSAGGGAIDVADVRAALLRQGAII